MNPIDVIAALFEGEGAQDYLGEAVTQAEHMRQAGMLARASGAPHALVAAALLHDVGHFQGAITGRDLMRGTDNRHSDTGADWLALWFGPAVTEPIRLHVAAKRYLCAVEPAYFGTLSPASIHTLAVQGGPMTPAEVERFETNPYWSDAVALRRWDEQAKDAAISTPEFDSFRDTLDRLLIKGRARPVHR